MKDLGGGRYSFTMPGSKVTVAASFKAAGHAFTDVPSGSYYADAVAWAVENGITGGISADTFAPNAACTRAQARHLPVAGRRQSGAQSAKPPLPT